MDKTMAAFFVAGLARVQEPRQPTPKSGDIGYALRVVFFTRRVRSNAFRLFSPK